MEGSTQVTRFDLNRLNADLISERLKRNGSSYFSIVCQGIVGSF